MKRMFSHSVVLPLILAVVFVVVTAGCIDAVPGPEVSATVDEGYAADEDIVLNVVNTNGRISVQSWEGDTITLDAVKTTRYGEE